MPSSERSRSFRLINPHIKSPGECLVLKRSSSRLLQQPYLITIAQNNQTYQNSTVTAAKNPSHTLHPTPVLSAILSILFIVPRNLTLVLSNELFMVSASLEESRISSPIATVIYRVCKSVSCRYNLARVLQDGDFDNISFPRKEETNLKGKWSYIFQHLNLCTYTLDLCVVLILELGENSVTVLTPRQLKFLLAS